MKLSLPRYVTDCMEKLEAAGFSAYAVGGCVRDSIMAKAPEDYDLSTDADPEQIKAVFSDRMTIDTGMKHGTVTVMSEHHPVEITVFRTESGYSDGRHPDSVSFTKSLTEDLARRDFTVNAIAYSDRTGIIDPFGGASDISRGILRCVGTPSERFREDALRILRAVRFASRLGFSIDTGTEEAMLKEKGRLSLISAERIAAELKKAVCGDFFENALLRYSPIFTEVIPELLPCVGYSQNNPHHDFDLLTHLAKAISASPVDYRLRFAALLHDIGKPHTESKDASGISHYYNHAHVSYEMASDILKRLRFSNNDAYHITTLIRYHDGVIDETEKAVKRRLNQLGETLFFDLIALQRADNAAQTQDSSFRQEHYQALFQIARNVISNSECISLSRLAVNGNDMLALGLQGKDIGKALNFLLDAVLNGTVKNEHEELLAYCQKSVGTQE